MGVKRGATGSAIGAVIVLASLASAGRSQADSACIAAYEQTQTLRKDGRPLAAKAQAAICAREACPALLTKDCNKWLAELEGIIPSVILDPRAPNGGLRADVRVKLDGVALAERIDGKSIALEPGSHTFVFEADGAVAVERTLVLRDGDRNKKLTVTMAPAPAVAVVERPVPLGVWVFGGVAVAALATSAVFAIDGLGKKSDLEACKPRCAPDDVDAMSTRFTFADVAFGAGVMAGAAAVYLVLTRPTVEVSGPARAGTASTRPVAFATPLPGGGAVGLGARF